jgi:cell division protein FtsI (penicillin-binding protein 3)
LRVTTTALRALETRRQRRRRVLLASASRRSIALLVVLALALTGISARLIQVQGVASRRYAEMGVQQRRRQTTLLPERGNVFDRNGNDLALSIKQKTVWANPRVVTDPEGAAEQLATVLPKSRDDLLRALTRHAAFVYLARTVDDATAAKVAALGIPGVDFIEEAKRHYPTALAVPVVGTVDTDSKGLSGLEFAHDTLLRGSPGHLVVERDPAGHEITPGERRFGEAVRGRDLVLSLDQSMQYEAERVLVETVGSSNAKRGWAVVLDVATGDILAMANVEGGPGQTAHPVTSGHNAAIADGYEPGSTNKVITISAALQGGLVSPATRFSVPASMQIGKHTYRDHQYHPPIDWSTTDILTNSSNIGTIQIAKKVGPPALEGALRGYGFGVPSGIGLPGEASGRVRPASTWSATDMGSIPIGNGIRVTSLQMLDVYAAIANHGVFRSPRIVKEIIDEQGHRHAQTLGTERRVTTARVADQLNQMLREVVRVGTATKAGIPGYTVAGKTGTARKPIPGGYADAYMASFVGFAPAEAPRLAAIVVVDEPTPIYGGLVAAPAFAKIMQFALRVMRVPPPAPSSMPGVPQAGPSAGVELDAPDQPPAGDGNVTTSSSPNR